MQPFDLPAGPVLIIAPHPDDETLGCGGLIARTAARGSGLHTLFVTDGGASHPGSSNWDRERLAAERRREAEEALRRLGAGATPRTFLNLPDAAMPREDEPSYRAAVATVTAVLQELRPDLVTLPWRRDPHGDHRASWQLGMEAIAAWGGAPQIIEYAIWLDEFGAPADYPVAGEMERIALRVSAATKYYALLAHRSQLGELVGDDPAGFVLQPATIQRLTGPEEIYWRPCAR